MSCIYYLLLTNATENAIENNNIYTPCPNPRHTLNKYDIRLYTRTPLPHQLQKKKYMYMRLTPQNE